MQNALRDTIANLQKQMDELRGAMFLCQKMQEEQVEIESLDTERFWK